MRVHILGLPHTELRMADYPYCAYTGKIIRFAKMLHDDGRHQPIVYAAGMENGSDLPEDAVAQVSLPIHDVLLETMGEAPWTGARQFTNWDVNGQLWQVWNAFSILAIQDRIQPGDAIGVIAGLCQKPVADHFRALGHPILEWGIGYSGVLPAGESFKVFESNAWRSAVTGVRAQWSAYDRVIPNAYDPGEFLPAERHRGYLLFMGRLNADKGASIVREIAARSTLPVKVAGQGDPAAFGNVEYVGVVAGQEKAELLQGAAGVLVPSQYLEPLGGVAIEAQMAGVPAITTDWAAFPETVDHGVGGWRASTLADFLRAAQWATDLRPYQRLQIQRIAQIRFSTNVVQKAYGDWLDEIESIYTGAGWYELPA